MCIEAKNSAESRFHFSTSEWARAVRFQESGFNDRYAVLVVRKKTGMVTPERLDLLVDPVGHCDEGVLSREADGYLISY